MCSEQWEAYNPVYFPCFGSDAPSDSPERYVGGASGLERINQIQDIYEICCKLPPHEGNEIWLYGFSRGAYVVRAVAGLLHHIRALTSAGTSTFPGDYEEALQLYSEDKQGLLSLGQRQSFLATNTRQAPAINFLGAFDTVKRVSSGQHLYDISLNESILHLRHALAVNKDWIALEPEYLFPDISTRNSFKKRTFVKHGV